MTARVLIIGLDCLSPHLVFERWRDRLPTLKELMREGEWGLLQSTDPPITVPAWASMLTGRDPGELGLYGFNKRTSYDPRAPSSLVSSLDVGHPWIWELVGDAGLDSLVVGVPPTWPPREMRGRLVTDFLTPPTSSPFTWPESLTADVARAAGGPYLLDVSHGRHANLEDLASDVSLMTRRRFDLFCDWLEETDFALAVLVEIGLDRLQHSVWHEVDPTHPRYPGPNGPGEKALLDYHVLLDGLVAKAMQAAGPDAHVIVVSDHGAQPMDGGVRINEWLRRLGWLFVEAGPNGEPADQIPWGTALSACKVDWKRSRAWAEGGYAARLYINRAGRNRDGSVPERIYEETCRELARDIVSIELPGNAHERTRVLWPETLYREVNGIAPDLMVYFGDLRWRALGTVGTAPPLVWQEDQRLVGGEGERALPLDPTSILSPVNDRGSDSANHAPDGCYIVRARGGARWPGAEGSMTVEADQRGSVSRVGERSKSIEALGRLSRRHLLEVFPLVKSLLEL